MLLCLTGVFICKIITTEHSGMQQTQLAYITSMNKALFRGSIFITIPKHQCQQSILGDIYTFLPHTHTHTDRASPFIP